MLNLTSSICLLIDNVFKVVTVGKEDKTLTYRTLVISRSTFFIVISPRSGFCLTKIRMTSLQSLRLLKATNLAVARGLRLNAVRF